MRIIFNTFVTQEYKTVTQKFDQNLLLALSPPFPRARIVRFDGNQSGDEVHIHLHFGIFRFLWKSLITAQYEDSRQWYFVDEGVQLPSPLRYWRHHHEVRPHHQGALIVDDITYQTRNRWLDFLLYPLIFLQFIYRKPVYKHYFRA